MAYFKIPYYSKKMIYAELMIINALDVTSAVVLHRVCYYALHALYVLKRKVFTIQE